MYILNKNGCDVFYLKKPADDELSKYQWIYVEEMPKGNSFIVDYANNKIYGYNIEQTKYVDAYQENKLLKAQLKAQTERADFIEDCIAEMAGVVYNTEETTT